MSASNIVLDTVPTSMNEYFKFVTDQSFASIEAFQLESGVELLDVMVAYKTWGKLNLEGNNCLVVCHALSGSSNIEDWWGPLLGRGMAFDISRYFIFCANVLGAPYGTTSPLSINPSSGRAFGPDFPQKTIRDDVLLHKLVLDALGVTSIAAVVGGSMGGMATLEWPLCTPKGYVKNIIPISTSVDHDAWGISWAEAQRQCVFADPEFKNGHYIPTPATQPASGLSAARMVAMLTYRSSPSFGARFGRSSQKKDNLRKDPQVTSHQVDDPKFSAQSYLQYQGEKFVRRFDANCFIHLTRKMDHHDVTRGRVKEGLVCNALSHNAVLSNVLGDVPSKALVVGIASDVLFTPEQQEVLVSSLPDASLVMIPSPEGHDGFLLEFEILGPLIVEQLRERCPWICEGPPLVIESTIREIKDSIFGEVESGW